MQLGKGLRATPIVMTAVVELATSGSVVETVASCGGETSLEFMGAAYKRERSRSQSLENAVRDLEDTNESVLRKAKLKLESDARVSLFIAKGRAVTRVELHMCVAKKPTRLYGHFS